MQLRTVLTALVFVWFATWQSASSCAAEILATAAKGRPYGICTIELPIAAPVVGATLPPLNVTDNQGRVYYPISNDVRVKLPRASERPVPQPGKGRLLNRLGNLIREIAKNDDPPEQIIARRVTFLFEGDEPLQIRLSESNIEIGVYDITPVTDDAARTRILQQWWTTFNAAAKRQIDAGDYPPWVETYLVAMLSGQTGAALPQWYQPSEADDDQLTGTLKLLAGSEGVGESTFRQVATGQLSDLERAALPVPNPPTWVASPYPPVDPKVAVEPIATRIPPECFYLRYGSFENYLWFRDLSDEYGGDLSRMITLRGVNDDAASRVEQQLNLKTTQLSRLLGPTVIDDQVLFGRDLFLADGGAIGVIMKATNAFLLKSSIGNDRTASAKDPAVTLANLTIAGKPATFLSTSDNRIHSYMAVDGEYVCVATSKHLIQRFFEVGQSGKSLAASTAFRLSRQLMPLSRNDTIFAYFSPEFLQGLVSPQYMIELRRRLHAKSDISLVHLARIAAVATRQPLRGVEELIAAGFLPTGFGQRPDGSGVISVGDEVVDTLRGARGTFLPIADVQLEKITLSESQWYSKIASAYSTEFPQIDPIMIGVQRQDVEGDESLERLVVHAEIAPLVPEKYGQIAQQLGEPTRVSMRFAPDDIIAIQAHVASEKIGPPTHLFAGVKDTIPPNPDQFDGLLKTYRAVRQIPGYLGAWPQPHAIDRLPLGLGRGRPVGPGMTRLLGGLYRYTDPGFSVLSFQPEVLQATLPFIEAVEVSDLATVRLRVGNLLGSQLQGWINAQLYQRAAKSSAAGANFLNLLARQLKVKPDEALVSAKNVLGSQLQCPLGGEYQYSQSLGHWVSTAWNGAAPQADMPAGYVSPVLNWFRGAQATLTQYADRLVADAEVTIKHKN